MQIYGAIHCLETDCLLAKLWTWLTSSLSCPLSVEENSVSEHHRRWCCTQAGLVTSTQDERACDPFRTQCISALLQRLTNPWTPHIPDSYVRNLYREKQESLAWNSEILEQKLSSEWNSWSFFPPFRAICKTGNILVLSTSNKTNHAFTGQGCILQHGSNSHFAN